MECDGQAFDGTPLNPASAAFWISTLEGSCSRVAIDLK